MKTYTQDLENFNTNANLVKEQLLWALAKEGFITDKQAIDIASSYSVLITEKGMLGKMVDKFLKRTDEKAPNVTVVRVINSVEEDSKEER